MFCGAFNIQKARKNRFSRLKVNCVHLSVSAEDLYKKKYGIRVWLARLIYIGGQFLIVLIKSNCFDCFPGVRYG